MPSLFSMAKSLRLVLTSFPLSKIIGFIPASINCNAANKPAGPAPIITTLLVAFVTSLKVVFINALSWKGSLIKAIRVRFTQIVFALASIDFFCR